jgi:hypothetical protein
MRACKLEGRHRRMTREARDRGPENSTFPRLRNARSAINCTDCYLLEHVDEWEVGVEMNEEKEATGFECLQLLKLGEIIHFCSYLPHVCLETNEAVEDRRELELAKMWVALSDRVQSRQLSRGSSSLEPRRDA